MSKEGTGLHQLRQVTGAVFVLRVPSHSSWGCFFPRLLGCCCPELRDEGEDEDGDEDGCRFQTQDTPDVGCGCREKYNQTSLQ